MLKLGGLRQRVFLDEVILGLYTIIVVRIHITDQLQFACVCLTLTLTFTLT